MRQRDVAILFDYLYWLRDRVVAAAATLDPQRFRTTAGSTSRDLRSTLVHELDIEAGWRERLRGSPREVWDHELDPEHYPMAGVLREAWSRDEGLMRQWIDGLSDENLVTRASMNDLDGYPMWFYLVHVVTHGIQELEDAAVLLNEAGAPISDLGFLYYADARRTPAS